MTRAETRTRRAPGAASGFALVALAAALWGTDALFRRGLAQELPAIGVVFAEHVILVLLCSPVIARAVRSLPRLDTRDWAGLIFVGAGASALATALFTQAFATGDPTTALLLQKLQPLVAVVGAHFLLREKLLPRFPLYFVLAVGGAYLLTFSNPADVRVSGLVPALYSTSAAALWGLGTVFGRSLSAKLAFTELTALRFAIGLPAAALILLLQEGASGFTIYSVSDVRPLLLVALVPGLIALLLYYRGLRRTPASAATLAELAFPLTAVVVNYLAFGTTLTGTQVVGIVVLTGTILAMSIADRTRGPEALGVVVPSRLGSEGAPAA